MAVIQRSTGYQSLDITTSLSTTPVLDFASMSAGALYTGSSGASQTLTVYSSPTSTGTYVAMYDSDGTALTISIQASRCIEVPAAVFAAHFIKLVAGTSAETIEVVKKG